MHKMNIYIYIRSDNVTYILFLLHFVQYVSYLNNAEIFDSSGNDNQESDAESDGQENDQESDNQKSDHQDSDEENDCQESVSINVLLL